MDELNVHQLWGISPFIDLLAPQQPGGASRALDHTQTSSAASAAAAQAEEPCSSSTTAAACFLQVCPYDSRHTLATISHHHALSTAAAAGCQQTSNTQQQLQLFVYEAEPESLARHMLLLALLFDASFTQRERAEMFLELHGNVLLRQRTAEWLATASRWLEAAVVEQGDACQRKLQENPAQAAVGLFDLSMLRYKDRDALLEVLQRYRTKATFDMAGAWEGRCRKWYADRYDFRHNMVDWDYHMRLSQRGTPHLDPAAGSIIHFYHFRHWRSTGVAYELRESSYTATNTSMLATALGRTKEYKDRNLRDVGRSVSAYCFWGDILNPPYHAFGTVSDDPGLFKVVNKQFSHTAVDVAEHNVLGFIKCLCGAAAVHSTAAANDSSSSGSEAHRARAARGPTSIEQLQQAHMTARDEEQQQQPCSQDETTTNSNGMDTTSSSTGCEQPQLPAVAAPQNGSLAESNGNNAGETLHGLSVTDEHKQSKQENSQAVADAEVAQTAAAVQALLRSVRITLLTGDLQRSLTGKASFAQRFAGVTLGHRHMQMLGREYGLAGVLQRGAPVWVETAANMVQLSREQVAAYDAKLVELAAAAGFEKVAVECEEEGQRQVTGHLALRVRRVVEVE